MNVASWTRAAQADVARIDDFYFPLSPEFADRLGEAAFRAASFLAEHPRAGSPFRAGTRKWRVASFDFVLIYRIVPSGIEILRMRHASENWRAE
jgi:plasmid stabilization system protein ParE